MDNHMGVMQRKEKIQAAAAGGLALALSEILSLIKIFEMPQGGSVTPASMLPVILYALCFGPGWGFLAAFAYSLLQLMIGSYIVSPLQALCDYTLAYSALGIAGFFAVNRIMRAKENRIQGRLRIIPLWKIAAGTITAITGRLIFSVIAGVVFFKEFVPEGRAPIVHSFVYNGSFLAVESAITVAVLIALCGSLRLFPKKQR